MSESSVDDSAGYPVTVVALFVWLANAFQLLRCSLPVAVKFFSYFVDCIVFIYCAAA